MKEFLSKIFNRIDSIFKNGGNNWSSQRIMSMSLVMLPIIVWTVLSLKSLTMAPIPESVVVVIGLGLTGKVVSKHAENKSV